ncbi:GtrA family protein [Corynebacterium auriscanis]
MRPTTEDANVEERGVGMKKDAAATATQISVAEHGTTAQTGTAEPARGGKRKLFGQFMQFGIVGASGFVVNQAVFVVARKLFDGAWHIGVEDPFVNLLGSQFHMRWYHVFSVIAFVIANIWNFMLNRRWTFKDSKKRAWWKQLPQFMAVGVFGLLITLAVATLVINVESPLALPRDIFDSSSGLRTPSYWGNFIGVMVAVPANFLFNKLWTFRGSNKSEPEKIVRTIEPRVTDGALLHGAASGGAGTTGADTTDVGTTGAATIGADMTGAAADGATTDSAASGGNVANETSAHGGNATPSNREPQTNQKG